MRTLFLSNYYPPHARGGYEQWCQEVATELVRRGHQTWVLTSRAPGDLPMSEENGVTVFRLLYPEVEAGLTHTIVRLVKDRSRLEQDNLDLAGKLVADLRPDSVLIWGMWNIPRSVPALVEHLLPGRVAYYVCDYWLSLPNAYIQRWHEPARRGITQWPKRLLGEYFLARLEKEHSPPLELRHPICVSRAVRDRLVATGVPIAHAQVIYGGTQVEEFSDAAGPTIRGDNGSLKLLYIGRLSAEKGVHTAIRAMRLVADQGDATVSLDIVGHGHPDYEAELKSLVHSNNLDQQVSFLGRIPRSEIPAVLMQHDVLIFPSEWEEPFARAVLEAMAAGLVVVGTTTGGSGEILIEGETGLTFPAGDAQALAAQIGRLSKDTDLQRRLSVTGRRWVEQEFTFKHMVDRLEAALKGLQAGEFSTIH